MLAAVSALFDGSRSEASVQELWNDCCALCAHWSLRAPVSDTGVLVVLEEFLEERRRALGDALDQPFESRFVGLDEHDIAAVHIQGMRSNHALGNLSPRRRSTCQFDCASTVEDVEPSAPLPHDDLYRLARPLGELGGDDDILAFHPACRWLRAHHPALPSGANSSGQCAIAFRTGNGAACPRPQIDVLRITSSSSRIRVRVGSSTVDDPESTM